MTRIITITSGKGGVGKTSISVNLALQLAASGQRVCLFDADFGLANVDILLNLKPERTLADVVEGHCALADIVLHTDYGFDVIPGSSGVARMANLAGEELARTVDAFAQLGVYDVILFDTASGVSEQVISFCLAAPEVLLVITPEPTSLTDAYSLLKILSLNAFDGRAHVVVNHSRTLSIAKHTYEKFNEVVQLYLSLDIPLLGSIALDARVPEAIKSRRPLLAMHPETTAARCLKALTGQLIAKATEAAPATDLPSFWLRFLERMKGPLTMSGKSRGATPPSRAAAVPAPVPPPVLPETQTAAPAATAPTAAPDHLLETIATLVAEVQALRATVERLENRPAAESPPPSRSPLPEPRDGVAASPITTTPATTDPVDIVPAWLHAYRPEVLHTGSGDAAVDLYRVVRRSGAPLLCCFHRMPAQTTLPKPRSTAPAGALSPAI